MSFRLETGDFSLVAASEDGLVDLVRRELTYGDVGFIRQVEADSDLDFARLGDGVTSLLYEAGRWWYDDVSRDKPAVRRLRSLVRAGEVPGVLYNGWRGLESLWAGRSDVQFDPDGEYHFGLDFGKDRTWVRWVSSRGSYGSKYDMGAMSIVLCNQVRSGLEHGSIKPCHLPESFKGVARGVYYKRHRWTRTLVRDVYLGEQVLHSSTTALCSGYVNKDGEGLKVAGLLRELGLKVSRKKELRSTFAFRNMGATWEAMTGEESPVVGLRRVKGVGLVRLKDSELEYEHKDVHYLVDTGPSARNQVLSMVREVVPCR